MRLVLMLMFVTTPCFNPRICKRCDVILVLRLAKVFGFNPRICKRCDASSFFSVDSGLVSIHASVKDATKRQEAAIKAQRVSIHASVKDATCRHAR